MNLDVVLDSVNVCYAAVGLSYATYSVFKHNRKNSKLLRGLYAMYAATLIYLGIEYYSDLGMNINSYTSLGYACHIASKILFTGFLTIAMPWSLNVYMRLTDHVVKPKKNEETTQI